jgi:hypothetical protein
VSGLSWSGVLLLSFDLFVQLFYDGFAGGRDEGALRCKLETAFSEVGAGPVGNLTWQAGRKLAGDGIAIRFACPSLRSRPALEGANSSFRRPDFLQFSQC